MKNRLRTSAGTAAIVGSLIVLVAGAAVGEEANDSHIEPAAYTRSESKAPAQSVTFAQQPARVGDEVEQHLGLDLKMTMTMRQGNEVAGTRVTTVRTNQRRVLTTREVNGGRAMSIRVQYPISTKQESILEANDTTAHPQVVPQPVQGKSYLCRRGAEENAELVITDEQGNRPPTEEYEIVAQQMQMVGRQNPLAHFLAGRTIAVGEKVELPEGVASQLFNLGDKFGKVSKFILTLEKVQSERGDTYAVFRSTVEAMANGATQMRLEVDGPLVVDVATCRAQKMALIGPIGMSETRGSYSNAYQMIGTGKLNMSIASTYRNAKR
jgi:hypothetical protein